MGCIENFIIFGPLFVLVYCALLLSKYDPISALVLTTAFLIILILYLLFDENILSPAKPPNRVRNRKHQRQHFAESALCQCIICYDNHPIIDLPSPFSSNHNHHEANICDGCIVGWLSAEIETKTWDRIACPHPDCGRSLKYEEIEAALIWENKLFERCEVDVFVLPMIQNLALVDKSPDHVAYPDAGLTFWSLAHSSTKTRTSCDASIPPANPVNSTLIAQGSPSSNATHVAIATASCVWSTGTRARPVTIKPQRLKRISRMKLNRRKLSSASLSHVLTVRRLYRRVVDVTT